MTGRPRLVVLAMLVAAGPALSGCGSSRSGIAGDSASQALKATVTAFESSASFHLSASGSSGSGTFSFSLDLFHNGDASGTIDDDGTPIKIVVVGSFVYLEAPTAFWEHGSVPAATAQELNGNYAKLSQSESGSVDQFSYSVLAKKLGNPGTGKLTNKGTTTIDGQSVVDIQYVGTSGTGHIYLAASGPPYPVAIDHLNGSGTVTLSQWDKGTPPTAPSNEITLPDS